MRTGIIGIMLIVASLVIIISFPTMSYKSEAQLSHDIMNSSAIPTTDDNSTIYTSKEKNITLLSNPEVTVYDPESHIITNGLPSFWSDTLGQCGHVFICAENLMDGWHDNTSLQISTKSNNGSVWSYISGKGIDVRPNEKYELSTHMKLNEFARKSHVLLEGFNESEHAQDWYEIEPFCPPAANGPLEWQEFSCEITIPENITQIRPILYAGSSSEKDQEAVTLFDSIQLTKLIGPVMSDPNLTAQVVYEGLRRPISMAFLGPDDILVLEHYKGTVQRIVKGVKLPEPLLDANVAVPDGMLGLAVANNASVIGANTTYVFLYYTEASNGDELEGNHTIGNHLYRYELSDNGSKLVNPKLILDVPAGPTHNGGPVVVGPDNNVYLSVGELGYVDQFPPIRNKAVNYKGGLEPDKASGILRITMDGQPVSGILGNTSILNLYYGYGIRNSFGMDFDPVTKKLWMTDNGPDFGDEINLVEPGFNGGWAYISGMMQMTNDSNYENFPLPESLEDFNGNGKYSEPKFAWNHPVGPTALKFLASDKYGKEYENDMFVADVNKGRIYHFDLNQKRTDLSLQGSLADKIADTDEELQDIIFARGFDTALPDITDLEVGPDGYLYVVALNQGKIYKIVTRQPSDESYMEKSFLEELPTSLSDVLS